MKWLEKGALFLMSGVMPVFIAACYGTPMDDNFTKTAWGNVKDKQTGNPIANILVRCLRGQTAVDETYTNQGDGSYELWYDVDEPCETIEFKDVDGEDNGGQYAATSISFEDDAVVEMELED